MNIARDVGESVGQVIGYFNIVRRSQPYEYRQIMTMIATIFIFILINLIINHNIKKNKLDPNNNINRNNIFAQRILAIPFALMMGAVIGFLAEVAVYAKLAEAKQHCRYNGFVDNTPQFEQCVDNTNFHLQNKRDMMASINPITLNN